MDRIDINNLIQSLQCELLAREGDRPMEDRIAAEIRLLEQVDTFMNNRSTNEIMDLADQIAEYQP